MSKPTQPGGSFEPPEDFWLPPPEQRENRFFVKMKENPFVPIGASAW